MGEEKLIMKIVATADIHTDFLSYNLLQHFLNDVRRETPDVFIIAGDISHKLSGLHTFFKETRSWMKHTRIIFVPGNHDLWIVDEKEPYKDSIDKLDSLKEELRIYDIDYLPHNTCVIGDTTFIGNIAWYDYSSIDLMFSNVSVEVIHDRKHVYNNDAKYFKTPFQQDREDVVFAEILQAYLSHDLNIHTDSAVLITHFPLFKEQLVWKDEYGWKFSNAYFGNLTIGNMVVKHPDMYKIKHVISGHTHRPIKFDTGHFVVETVGGDYNNLKYSVFEI